MSGIKLIAAAGTEAKHPNGERENQDAVYIALDEQDPFGLLIVADGVGGHHEGSLASQTVIKTMATELVDIFTAVPISTDSAAQYLQTQLRTAIYRAHEAVLEHANSKDLSIASTVTCALVYNKMAIIANVGDSRTYIGRGYNLEQITSDHSLVAWLVRQNQLAPSDVQNHPYRNVIMHALGTPEPPQIDIFVRELDENDYLLLCSDGIWDSLSDAELASFLNTGSTLAEAKAEIMAAAQDHRDDLALIIACFVNNQSEPTT